MKTLSEITLKNANMSPSEILTKKAQKLILGGYGEAGYGIIFAAGTCGWDGGGSYKPICGISKTAATALQSSYGGYWCCDSCSSTSYCG